MPETVALAPHALALDAREAGQDFLGVLAAGRQGLTSDWAGPLFEGMLGRRSLFLFGAWFLATGCDKAFGNADAAPKPHASSSVDAAHAAPAPPGVHGGPRSDGRELKYGVPFAWEASPEEPLARAREFLREALVDNAQNARRGPQYFAAFKDRQTPRATVVTCADSRVHASAWDVTPDNDDFMVRNIGNQLANAHGSVEYGVEHLKTPLLLVLGHTGCGAVKAALGDLSKLEPSIKKELEPLRLPKQKSERLSDRAWADAVVANVHGQVAFAVEHFGAPIREGGLTVVGAVYDFRGDLGEPGRLHVVNVNANVEPERLRAFVAAVSGAPANGRGEPDITDTVRSIAASMNQSAKTPPRPSAAVPSGPAAPH